MKALKARLEPIEMSMDPVVTTISWAKANSIKTGVCWAMKVQFRIDMNRSPLIDQNSRITRAMAINGTKSRTLSI